MSPFEIAGLMILGGILCFAIAQMIVCGLNMNKLSKEKRARLRQEREQNAALCARL